jgi:hypothetical protein
MILSPEKNTIISDYAPDRLKFNPIKNTMQIDIRYKIID